jgi:chitodextrinase
MMSIYSTVGAGPRACPFYPHACQDQQGNHRGLPLLKEKPMKIKSLFAVTLLLLLLGAPAWATVYYVDRTHPLAKDTNPGTKDAPWLTIGHAEDVATNPGDVVYVRSGTYDERVTCQHSGSAGGGFIHFVGYPGDAKPIMRGFSILSQSYIRIIGFEITHNSMTYSYGITPKGSCSHIEILDNYIHNVVYGAVRWNAEDISYVTLRGNEMYMIGCPSGVPGECKGGHAVSIIGVQGGVGHHLLEYNKIHRPGGDFINVVAPYAIVRNNYLHDFRYSYFSDSAGTAHVDMFQPSGFTQEHYARRHVYESNFMGDNIEHHSHILQMRDSLGYDQNIIFRGNIGYNHGSYAMQCGGVDNVYFYNNTIHQVNADNITESATGYNAEGSNYSLNNHNFNNIYSDVGGKPIVVMSGNSCASSKNLGYLTGSHESLVSIENPMFVNSVEHDFHLQAASPAIDLGKAITTVTSATGGGTSFDVEDAGFFCDGYGIADGDIIKVGANNPARITAVNANTITVDQPLAWKNGDGVYWKNQDTFPDIGAYEYRADGYGFAIEITGPTDQGNVSGLVPIAAGVTNAENIRFAVFYIDGIPAAKVTESPYSYTWDTTSLEQGSRHFIEVRAYALHATPRMTESDQIVVVVGPAIDPLAPSELNIIAVTSNTVSLGWPDSIGAFGYRVYRDGQPVGDTINNRYTDTGLTPQTTYRYTVTARGAGAYESSAAGPVSAVTSAAGSGGGSGEAGGGGGGGGGCFINTAVEGTFPGLLALIVITAILGLIGFTIRRHDHVRPSRIMKGINRKKPMKTFGLKLIMGVCAAVLIMAGNAWPATTSTISQYGITWTFDKPYEYGQFANGDYWVVGPVVITRIEPDFDGENHGWEVNPRYSDLYNLPYEQGFSKHANSSGLYFNPALVPSLPYTAMPGQSIVKAVSNWNGSAWVVGNRCLKTAAVLTVVGAIPPDNGATVFRPPYAGTVKPLYSVNNIQWNPLPSFAPPAVMGRPSLKDIEDRYQRVQLGHIGGALQRSLRPVENFTNTWTYSSPQISDYGCDSANDNGDAVLRLMENDSQSDKKLAVICLIQYAIDHYHTALIGQHWSGGGGWEPGAKLILTFAATLLNNIEMKNMVNNANTFTFEDTNTLQYSDSAGGPVSGMAVGQRAVSGESAAAFEEKYWRIITFPDGAGGGFKTRADPYGYVDAGREETSYMELANPYYVASALVLHLMPSMQSVWNGEQTLLFLYADRWVNHGWWYQPDSCAPAGVCSGGINNSKSCSGPEGCPGGKWLTADEAWPYYKTVFGPDGQGSCIKDTNPDDGIGRFPKLHGKKANGLVRNYVKAMWAAYRNYADTQAPSVPVNLSGTAVSSTQINLTWTASTDNVAVTSYRIYGNGAQIATSVTNSYNDAGLTSNTQYNYNVTAYDVAGNVSEKSSGVTVTTPGSGGGGGGSGDSGGGGGGGGGCFIATAVNGPVLRIGLLPLFMFFLGVNFLGQCLVKQKHFRPERSCSGKLAVGG